MSTKNWLQSEHPWAHCCDTHYPGSMDGPVPAQHWISDSHPSLSNTVRIPLPQVNVSRKAHDWNGSLLWWHCRWFPALSYLGMGPCQRAWCRERLPWTRCQSSGYSSAGIPLVRCSMAIQKGTGLVWQRVIEGKVTYRATHCFHVLLAWEVFWKSKVNHLDAAWVSLLGKHEVFWLDIPMGDIHWVDIDESRE